MGWNSFDSYAVYLYDEAAHANLEAMAKMLKPHGYEYFVVDGGWYGEYDLYPGTTYTTTRTAKFLHIDEFGLVQPSQTYFPNGFRQLIDRCHELGLKFGVHMMRGIPKEAAERNTLIKGTQYRARDIIDTVNVCKWMPQNWGVDMSKPGAQEYYNSLIDQFAEWGVDFIKYDDIVPFPLEVEAVAKAIEQCGRPIVFSLSPGLEIQFERMDLYQKADMMRVTNDIWDWQKGIDMCFEAWKKWQDIELRDGFYADMDMIPFGRLQLQSPVPSSIPGFKPGEGIDLGDKWRLSLFAGRGYTRQSEFTPDQMRTFMAMRALAASPLMMGGDLPTLDDYSLKLITDPDMLACNRNGEMGKQVYEKGTLEVWAVKKRGGQGGWIGVFNRSGEQADVRLTLSMLGLDGKGKYELYDIWNARKLDIRKSVLIGPNGVVFIKY